MKILQYLNGNLVFPVLSLFVAVVYMINRGRNRRKFKR